MLDMVHKTSNSDSEPAAIYVRIQEIPKDSFEQLHRKMGIGRHSPFIFQGELYQRILDYCVGLSGEFCILIQLYWAYRKCSSTLWLEETDNVHLYIYVKISLM